MIRERTARAKLKQSFHSPTELTPDDQIAALQEDVARLRREKSMRDAQIEAASIHGYVAQKALSIMMARYGVASLTVDVTDSEWDLGVSAVRLVLTTHVGEDGTVTHGIDLGEEHHD
jgi:uncharacterized small protein (DUF1192 family)